MNLNNKKITLCDALYILAYGLLLSKVALSNTTFLKYIDFRADEFMIINLLAIMIIGFKVIRFDITSPKKILLIALLAMCVMLSYYYAAYNNLIMLFVLIIGSFNVDIRAIVKCHFVVYGVIAVLAFICSILGIIEDYTVVRTLTGEMRHSFGNTYPTDFAAGILYLELDYAFLKKHNWKMGDTSLLMIFNYTIYRFTDANSFIITSSVLCFAMLIYGKTNKTAKLKKSKDEKNVLNRIAVISFPICAAISFVLIQIYRTGNPILRTIDIALGYRMGFSAKAMDQYGIGLFGSNITFTGAGWSTDTSRPYYYVDNGYIYASLLFGLLIMFIICFMMSYSAYYIGESNRKMSLIYIIIAASSLIEPRLSNYLYNSFLLLFGSCAFRGVKTALQLGTNRPDKKRKLFTVRKRLLNGRKL